jgi:Tfp pilus assembly protein PilE
MGQQQLLLIVLGVIIVGVAVAVGVSQFRSSAVDSNRQAVISDIVNLAAKAQRYYRTPAALAGGGQSFSGFALSSVDTGNANGSYSLGTAAPSDSSLASGSTTATTADQTVYVVGCGKEQNGTNFVKVYATVSANNITTTIVD